jgi:hypothetical protein
MGLLLEQGSRLGIPIAVLAATGLPSGVRLTDDKNLSGTLAGISRRQQSNVHGDPSRFGQVGMNTRTLRPL